MSEFSFSKKTFTYFDGARRHASDRAWFDANQKLYAEHVEVPLTHLIVELNRELAPRLPGIAFSPRKIAKPLLRGAKDKDGPVLRESATAFFSEPATSMFETNPGIYLSIGAGAEDNVVGCGLYMPSSRQTNLLRPAFYSDYTRLDGVMHAPEMLARWQGLTGESYKRFPKEFDPDAPGAKYVWHKRFLLSKHVGRDVVTRPEFIAETVEDLRAAVPFLEWLRSTVGVYKKPAGGYAKDRER